MPFKIAADIALSSRPAVSKSRHENDTQFKCWSNINAQVGKSHFEGPRINDPVLPKFATFVGTVQRVISFWVSNHRNDPVKLCSFFLSPSLDAELCGVSENLDSDANEPSSPYSQMMYSEDG
jgi:hypothetical protein